jgi:hypothetical protein
MSIWCSHPVSGGGYDGPYPDTAPSLTVDVAASGLSPLIRIAAWSTISSDYDSEFFVSRETAEQMRDALEQALAYSKAFDA